MRSATWLLEPVEPGRVAGQDEVALGERHAREGGLDGAPAVRCIGADVGIVARPQHALHADAVTVPDAERVGHEAEMEVALDVLARRGPQPEAAHGIEAVIVVVDLLPY